MMQIHTTEQGNYFDDEGEYIPALPKYRDHAHAKSEQSREHAPRGINHWHTAFLLLIQIGLLVIYGITVSQDKYPKSAAPTAGSGEDPTKIDYVKPFKRYPPGYDIFTGTDLMNAFKVEEHYSSFIQIFIFTFLGLPWSFSFLRRYAYSTVGFGLVSACICTQFGIISMQVVDRVHCTYLLNMLAAPDFDTSQLYKSDFPANYDLRFKCLWTGPTQKTDAPPLDEIEDSFGQTQLRQACYCDLWNRMSANTSLQNVQPMLAHQALLVTGHADFKPSSFSLSFTTAIDGVYATVPVIVSFGVVLGKMSPIQLVPFGLLNVVAYAFNLWVCTYVIGAWDHTGGACVNHIFGACFGIAASAASYTKGSETHKDAESRYHMDVMALIGTLFVWVYYPSYNCFYAPSMAQQAVAVNTFLSVLGSAVSALAFSAIFTGQFRLTITDVQRSTIAGGVAMSSNANLVAEPWMALIIGFCGGAACSFGIHHARPFWVKNIQMHDTVGVTSMHLYPAIISWIAGILLFLPLNNDNIRGDQKLTRYQYALPMDEILNHNNGDGDAVLAQLYIAPMSIAIGLVTGTLAGMMTQLIQRLEPKYMYIDTNFFVVPEDFKEQEELAEEEAAAEAAAAGDDDSEDEEDLEV
mmetsp:Transcript_12872/g.35671  ORF Transcript_12872/g.35671 Transcript_12872/m.35671 type:complete len:635 (+) Transcript_12872:3-1907(+)